MNKKPIKAGALYYAVFISFIVTVLCGFFIFFHYLNNQIWLNQLRRDTIHLNIESVLNIFRVTPEKFSYETVYEYIINENEVKVTRKYWGAYDILNVSANNGNYYYDKNMLVGGYDLYKDSVALYLADHKKYLSLVGDALLKGNCVLPEMGVKRAYIEGKGYIKNELIYGKIDTSLTYLPEIDLNRLEWIKQYMSKNIPARDTIVFIDEIKEDIVRQSFKNSTLVIICNESEKLFFNSIAGNVIIISDNRLILDSEDHFNDVIIMAPEIVIGAGFEGNVQLFASENIFIEESTSLTYPSFCALICDSLNSNPQITLKENSKLFGGLLSYFESSMNLDYQTVISQKGAHIFGDVYINKSFEHRGIIHGTSVIDKFVLETANASYEDIIFDGVFDYEKLNDQFVKPLFLDYDNMEVIKWLN